MNKKRFEVPLAGLVFMALTAFTLVAAMNSQSNILYFVFGLLFGVLVLSGFIAGRMLRKLEVRRLASDHVEAGRELEISYEIYNQQKHWSVFGVQIGEHRYKLRGVTEKLLKVPLAAAVFIPRRGRVCISAPMCANGRGVLELTHFRITCSFPFGFLRRTWFYPAEHQIYIYPKISELNRDLVELCRLNLTNTDDRDHPMKDNAQGLSGQDEFYSLREYRPGDNTRAIHWKRSARTGELVVREMTDHLPPRFMIALDLRKVSAGSEKKVEEAITLAASVICHGFKMNYAMGLCLPGLVITPRIGREQRSALLRLLATLEVKRESGGESNEMMVDRGVLGGIPLQGEMKGISTSSWLVIGVEANEALGDFVPKQRGSAPVVLALDSFDPQSWYGTEVTPAAGS